LQMSLMRRLRRHLFRFVLFFIFSATVFAQWNERKIEVANGVSLRVIEAGQDPGVPALVFIPGWSTGGEIWREQIDHFAAHYRVISFDPRSQGESTITTDGNTPEMRAQDLHVLMEKAALRRPIVIAWSQAVQDIAAYVQRYGSNDFGGVVLVDAAVADGADGVISRPRECAEQMRMFPIYLSHQSEFLQGMFRAIISKTLPKEAMDKFVATGLKTPPAIGEAMLVADLYGINRTEALKKIQCSVLVIASSKSEELERQRNGAAEMAHARFEQMDGAAHALFLDQPQRFSELLEEFVKQTATRTANSSS
jgi:non-heme chloroperoxidase